MAAGVFVIQEDGGLVEMSESGYETEAVLQELIARYPNLLVGDQIDSESPRRWLLVSRELGLASEKDGANRWSLDHLFLDQDAIPTLVEVKRSSDTRIRREVVGQMLDYAANAVVYLPVERIQSRFSEGCQAKQRDPDEVLASFLGPEGNADAFWQALKTNLQAGRIRMLFVADVIPQELRRIVEFLNGQMNPAEVLAVEIRQFVSEKMKTLVPRVIGQTAVAERLKPSGGRQTRQWDEPSFFARMEEVGGTTVAAVARRIFEWGRSHGTRVDWGKGMYDGSMIPVLTDSSGREHFPLVVYTRGRVEIQFQWLQLKPPFDDLAVREELLLLLNKIPRVTISSDKLNQRPTIALLDLDSPSAWAAFQRVLARIVERVTTP